MFRVFVAQKRGGALHVDMSQNILFTVKQMNRALEKKKKKDFWRLVWFSDPFERADAQKYLAKLSRINSMAGMYSVMKEARQDRHDEATELQGAVQEFMK
jgi:hypothetical protein